MNNFALKYIKKNSLKLEQTKIDKTHNNEIIIKIHSCGICGSDLKILKKGSNRVKENTVLGHEISGEIVSVESGKYFKKGQKIILGADIPNKSKKDFAFGHEIDGGFQQYLRVNNNLLRKAPHYLTKSKINHNSTCLVEPLACCLNGFEKINFKPNKNVVIFGAGSIGNIIAKLSIYYKSKKIFLIDINNYKLARGIRGKNIFKFNFKNYKKKIFSIMKKKDEINYCFVACNSYNAQNEAINIISKNGSINFFSGLEKKDHKDPFVKINTNLIHYKQLKIVGSHGSEKKHIIKAAKLIIKKKIILDDIITHIYSLKKIKQAFNIMKTSKCIKIIIKPQNA
jgi:L-iditol 2-dehydrogenase